MGVGMNKICNLMSPSSFEKQVPEVELDKLHVRDNVKLAEVHTKMFLYQDNQSKLMFCYCVTDFFAVCSAIYYSRFM